MIEKEIVICLGKAQESAGGSGGGSSNYSDLTNKPKINGEILVGNKTSSQLGLQSELTAGSGIAIETSGGVTTISATGVTAIDDELSTTSELPVQNKVITNALNGKVDEETGKGLSANDFTDTLKTKLDGIETSADVNTIESISRNNVALTPDANKNVNITVPVNTSDLVNDNNTVIDANYVHTDNNYTTAEKEKLANLGTASQKDFTTQITQNSEDLITSGAVHTGLGLKLDASLKGAAEGVAELDENGKILTSQLPASIDEIIEAYFYEGAFYQDQQHTVLITGQTNKIYVDLVSNKTYRWGGSEYVEISESLVIGETSSTAGRGDHTKTAYDHSQLVAGNPHNVTKAEVGLGNCDNTSDLNKPISTATQTALDGKIGTGLLPVAETNIKAIDSYMLASDLNITDANDIKYKYGVVCCNGQTVSHLPSTDYYNVHVEIVNNDPNKIIQTAIKNSSPVETYVRRSADLGSTWSDWHKIIYDDSLNDLQLTYNGSNYPTTSDLITQLTSDIVARKHSSGTVGGNIAITWTGKSCVTGSYSIHDSGAGFVALDFENEQDGKNHCTYTISNGSATGITWSNLATKSNFYNLSSYGGYATGTKTWWKIPNLFVVGPDFAYRTNVFLLSARESGYSALLTIGDNGSNTRTAKIIMLNGTLDGVSDFYFDSSTCSLYYSIQWSRLQIVQLSGQKIDIVDAIQSSSSEATQYTAITPTITATKSDISDYVRNNIFYVGDRRDIIGWADLTSDVNVDGSSNYANNVGRIDGHNAIIEVSNPNTVYQWPVTNSGDSNKFMDFGGAIQFFVDKVNNHLYVRFADSTDMSNWGEITTKSNLTPLVPYTQTDSNYLMVHAAQHWNTYSNKALCKAYTSSGELVFAGILQWNGISGSSINDRIATKQAGSGSITATNNMGTVSFSKEVTYVEMHRIGSHD